MKKRLWRNRAKKKDHIKSVIQGGGAVICPAPIEERNKHEMQNIRGSRLGRA